MILIVADVLRRKSKEATSGATSNKTQGADRPTEELRASAGAVPPLGQELRQTHRWDSTRPSSGCTAKTWIWTGLRAIEPEDSCTSRGTRPSWLAWDGKLSGFNPDSRAYCTCNPEEDCGKPKRHLLGNSTLQSAVCYGAAHLRSRPLCARRRRLHFLPLPYKQHGRL